MGLSHRLRVAVALTLVVVLVGTVGYELLLGSSLLDALYMTGMGILILFASTMTAFFVEGELTNLLRRRKMEQTIQRLSGHVILCGIGHIGGLRMTSEMIRPHVVSFLDRMLRPGEQATWRFEELTIEPGAAAIGRTLGSLDIPGRIGLPVLALSAGDGRMTDYPPADTVLAAEQRLVVLAEHEQVERLRQLVASG